MKPILTIILLTLFGQSLFAQVPLSEEYNSMRMGDILCKIEIPYVDAGARGSDNVWTLGEASKDSPDYWQAISRKTDTIAVYERNTINHYIMQGDTLFCKGQQSRRAYQIYDQMRPQLRYPFAFGDSISGQYSGKGRDENLSFSMQGFGYTIADGTGMLTDGEDTLHHVMRLHLHDIQTTGDSSNYRVITDRYHWYCAGYRYPVMESVIRKVEYMEEEDSRIQPHDSVTYLYLPAHQMELDEDAANQNLLELLADMDAQSAAGNGGSLSNISASISSDGMQLVINYELSAETSVSFTACDIVGNILGHDTVTNQESGSWQQTIQLSRRPIGNTLMLSAQCAGQYISLKVVI